MCLILGIIDLDHLLKVRSDGFLLGKVTILPFVMKKYPIERYFETL